ncbi:MAG: hypothetical protein U9Q83_07875 [Bacteroidota bacterium]|nr:hypothetical protein [Bacteroidota bacterium]
MKKIILLFGLILISSSIFAQKISMLHPTLVVWKNDADKVSLKEAKYGVVLKDNLSLDVYIHQMYFNRMDNPNEISLEFRWYYYLSTRRSLMYVDKVSYKDANKKVKNVTVFSSVQKDLQNGWWEVQIVNAKDAGFLRIGKVSKFQIFVK